jgi:uracil-DNA glycosylase
MQIFLDLAVLVEAQGEMLDDIENQVRRCDRCLLWQKDVQVPRVSSPFGG